MTASVIYEGNDSRIVLRNVKDRTGALVTGATVTLEAFTDRAGNAVSGLTLPATLSNLSANTYALTVSRSIGVAPGKRYYATVRAEYSGLRGEWRETIVCQRREG